VTAAILTLAVGIGANVAMFSVANLALFRALPYPDAEELVVGRTVWPGGGVGWTSSAPDYYDIRDRAESFKRVSAITPFTWPGTVTAPGEAERLPAAWVSPGFFATLGVEPMLGREFLPEEGEPGGPAVLILSHELYQRRFGAGTPVIGETMTVEGMPMTIVGVMPPGFTFLNDAQAWMPMVPGEAFASLRRFHNWLVVARLADGVTLREARAEVDVIMRQLAEAYPDSNEGKGMVITPMLDAFTEGLRPSLLMLMGAIGLVLLIACGNVASLMLARGNARSTELAVRSAMGAGGGRLVRQLLTESAVLAVGAGLLGTAVAVLAQRSLVAATPLTRLGLEAAGIQPEVLVFALVLSLVTVLVFGLAPALSAARVDLVENLKAGAGSVAGGRGRFRHGLVVVQVALSVMLLVGAGLLIRSFVQLRGVDPGFETENLLTADIGLPRGTYTDAAQRSQFYDELMERARALPGVESVGLVSRLPIRDPGNNTGAWNPSNPPADASEVRLAYQRIIKPGYFETMGIPILRGRDVRPTDVTGSPPVAVISESMTSLFPDQDPLGQTLAMDLGGDDPALLEIVGIVGNIRPSGLAQTDNWIVYFSYGQRPANDMRLAVRTAGPPSALIRPLRSILAEMDPDIPLADARSMEEILSGSVSFTRTVMGALAAFAAVALFLAAIGLYGVLAYYVSRRTHEIGVRVALGAGAWEILRMVLGRGLVMVALGLALGIGGALAGGRLVQELLFQVEAADPATFAAVSGFFALVALAACLIPAWRAWRVDPVVAFRAE